MKGVNAPLADRMRPDSLSELVGQRHLSGPGKPLTRALDSGRLHSMILWGPPGCGKTTLALILTRSVDARIIKLSAVLAGVADLRRAIAEAEKNLDEGYATVLFVDEVHRFNKAQQDAFLPHVESGLLTLIGATTENPAFELRSALLSRARVYVLKPHAVEDLVPLLSRGVALLVDEGEIEGADDEALKVLAVAADGDARRALGFLEIAAQLADGEIDEANAAEACATTLRRFDKGGDAFYDQISALHKSIRSTHPDAALYWFCRMLDGGCDPRYIARRLTRIASEDIGNADPRALELCLNAWQAYERIGSPEGELALGQAVIYLASCAKSNACYDAYKLAQADVKEGGSLEVPPAMRNAPTRLARSLGHGKGYRYDHDEPDGIAYDQNPFPEELGERIYYRPVDRGLEIKIREKMDRIRALRGS